MPRDLWIYIGCKIRLCCAILSLVEFDIFFLLNKKEQLCLHQSIGLGLLLIVSCFLRFHA